MRSPSIESAKFLSARERKRHHLSFDHDAVMMEKNPEQKAAFSYNLQPHLATFFVPKSKMTTVT